MAEYRNQTFTNNHFTQSNQGGGALLLSDADTVIENCVFDNNGGSNFATYGGAIGRTSDIQQTVTITDTTFSNNYAHHGGAINLAETVNLVNVTFTNNHAGSPYGAGYGGAIFTQWGGKTLNYTVTDGHNIVNAGNTAAIGGFLYDHVGESVFTFTIEQNASLTIGSIDSSADSINLHKGSKLVKTGDGTMTINSVLERRHLYTDEGTCTDGDITVEDGTLELDRGGTFDGTVKLTGGQLKLGAAYTFNSVEFELKTASSTPMIADWTKLSTSLLTIDVENTASGTYILAGNATAFDRNITITNNSISQTIGKGQSVTIDGTVYSLNVANNNLTLTANGGSETGSLVVTTAADVVDANDGVISLREAIAAAKNGIKAADGTYTITFDDSIFIDDSVTITLNSTLDIEADIFNDAAGCLTIQGAEGKSVILDGNNAVQIMSIDTRNYVTIDNMILQHGYNDEGSAIMSHGRLSINNSTIRENRGTAVDSHYAENDDSLFTVLTVKDSLFEGNNGISYEYGGAVEAYTRTYILNSTFKNNTANEGAGVFFGGNDCDAVVDNCTFVGNSASSYGGAIEAWNANTTVTNSTFTGNSDAMMIINVSWGAAMETMNLVNNIFAGNSIRYYSSGAASETKVNNLTNASVSNVFAEVENGKVVLNEDGTVHLRTGGAADGTGVYVWHNEDYSAIAYSETYSGEKTAVVGNAADATILSTDQMGNQRSAESTTIGATLTTEGEAPTPVDPSFDNNHSFETAYFLGTDSDIAVAEDAALNESYEQDYYSFTLTQRSAVTLTTSGSNGGDTQLYLYNANHEQLAYNDDGGDGYFSKINNQTLAAGTYYVMVKAYGSGTVSNYNLTTDVTLTEAGSLVVTTGENVTDATDGVTSLAEAVAYAKELGGNQIITFNIADGDEIDFDRGLQITTGITIEGINQTTNNHIQFKSEIIIQDGASLRDFTVFNNATKTHADLWAHDGSILENVTAEAYGQIYCNDASCSSITVKGQGDLITADTTFSDISIDYQGVLVYSTGNLFEGNLIVAGAITQKVGYYRSSEFDFTFNSFEGNASQVNQNTNVTFDLSGWLPGQAMVHLTDGGEKAGYGDCTSCSHSMLIDNMAVFTGAGSYTISVKADQALGTYLLAGNAADFNATLSLTVGENTYTDVLTVGNTYTIGDNVYTLALNDDDVLTLNIAEVEASGLVVTTAEDVVDANDGVTSLREALAYAEELGGNQTITFNIEETNNLMSRNNAILTVGKNTVIDGVNTATGSFIKSTIELRLQEGDVLKNYSVYNTSSSRSFGDICSMAGSSCDNIIVERLGDFYNVSNTASDICVKNDGTITAYNSTISNLTIEYGGVFVYSLNNTLTGNIIIKGAVAAKVNNFEHPDLGLVAATATGNDASQVTHDTHLELSLVDWTPGGSMTHTQNYDCNRDTFGTSHSMLIDNMAVFTGAGSYTISVKADQALGTYLLAGNAADFDATLSLTVGENTYTDVLTVGNTYTIGDSAYTLALNDDDVLTLNIAASTPETSGLVVTTAEDVVDANDGVTSLREALAYASTLDGKQTITFANDYNITLNSQLTISSDVVIDGGSNSISIYVPMFNEEHSIVFNGDELQISNIAFIGTDTPKYETEDFCECILFITSGSLYVNGCTFEDMKADRILCGARYLSDNQTYADTYICVENSSFIGNDAMAISFGGDGLANNILIYNTDYTECVIFQQGDLYYPGGVVNLVNSTIVDTAAKNTYWGWSLHSQSNFNILNTIIVNNCTTGKGFYSNMCSETKARYSMYTSGKNELSLYSDFTNNVTGTSISDLFPEIQVLETANGIKYLIPEQQKLSEGTAALAAIDEENNLYYSIDGTNWYRYSDRAAANVDSSWILNTDVNGNVRSSSNNAIGMAVNALNSYVVTTANDVVDANDGVTSLREAIAYAEELGGEQTVTFHVADTNEIEISSFDPLKSSVNLSRLNEATGQEVVFVVNDKSFSGYSSSSDGGVYGGTANLEVNSSTFSSNRASVDGGALYGEDATISINDSTFSGNRCNNEKSGGAVAFEECDVTIDGATFENNFALHGGGALASWESDDELEKSCCTTITNSVFRNNNVWGYGGALKIYHTDIAVTDTTFTGNYTGNSTYCGWGGGAIWIEGADMTYTVTDGTDIVNSGNHGTYGGFLCFGVYHHGDEVLGTTATFDVQGTGTLTIGTGNQNTTYDSFASGRNHSAAETSITKTGSGLMTINAAVSMYDGNWVVEDGTLSMVYGGDFDGEITITNGTLDLTKNYTFTTLDFDLMGHTSIATMVTDIRMLSGGSWQITVGEEQAIGDYLLAGNAADFNATLSLTVGENTYTDVLTVGNTYTIGDNVYTLALNDDDVLTLTIAESVPVTSGLVVTTGEDVVDANDGVVSLREAIAYAQELGGEQTITFAQDMSVNVNSVLTVSGDITISGTDRNITINLSDSAEQLLMQDGGNLTLTNLKFIGNYDEIGDYDECVFTVNSGNLMVTDCTFSQFGGDSVFHIRREGNSEFDRVSFTENHARGILTHGYTLVNNSLFYHNTAHVAGAVFAEGNCYEGGGTINVVNTTILDNFDDEPYYGRSVHSQYQINILNSIVVDQYDRKGIYTNWGGGYTVRNSAYTTASTEGWGRGCYVLDSLGNVAIETLFPDSELKTTETGVLYANPDYEIAEQVTGVLAAVDAEHNLYYSTDGVDWYRFDNQTAVTESSSWTFLNTDVNGKVRTADNNTIGMSVGDITPTPPEPIETDQDDQISEARTLVGTVTDSIENNQDVDLYKFTVSADEKISLQTAADGDNLTVDTYLRLFDAQGNELAADDDSGVDHYSRFGYTFREAGTYYVGVSYYTNTKYDVLTGDNDRDGKTGSYQLTLTRDGYDDSDDQISEASALAADTTVSGNIAFASDVDMYKFTIAENESGTFTVESSVDAAMRIFDGEGNELVSGTGTLDYAFQSAGTYYLGISGNNNKVYSPVSGTGDTDTSATGTYSVSMTLQAASYQDPDDKLATAIAAENTTVLTGALDAKIDVDLYKFTVSADEELTFTLSSTAGGTDFDSYIRLFDANGVELDFNDDNVNGAWSGLTYRFAEAGTVYLGVSAQGNKSYNPVTGEGDVNAETGDYTLTVRSRMTQTVFLSSATDLGTVTASGPVVSSASIDRPSQVNMYSFDVSAGDTVWINLDNLAGSNLDSYFRLFDGNGTQLAANDDGAAAGESERTCESYLEYTFANAGKYYLGVSSYGNDDYEVTTNALVQSGNSSGSYRLAFGLIVKDTDNDDTLDSATALSAGVTHSDTLDTATDVDMYKVSLACGETLTASISLQGLQDSYLRLFDADGNELAANDDGGFKSRSNAHASQIVWQAQNAGTYYLGVSGYGNILYNPVDGSNDKESRYTGNYSITADVEAAKEIIADDEYENNDTMSDAASLGTVSGTKTIFGLTMNDEADWYKFTISKDTGVESRIALSTEDSLSLNVYQSDGTLVGYATDGTQGVSLADLSAGDYYFKISGNESKDYSVSLNITEAPVTEPANAAENYVVLFSGGYNSWNNRTYYYDSIKNMYEIATETYNVDADHIYILFADGTNSAADNIYGQNSDMSYASDSVVLSATESNLRKVFHEISVSADSNDHFLFYSFDHGSEAWDGTDYLCGWNDMIEDEDFAVYAEEINAGYQTYLMAQCYSGGMIEDLTLETNMFAASASNAQSPSTSWVSLFTGKIAGGFSKSVEDALAEGINSTYALYQKMQETNPSAQIDNPQQVGSDFNIFATGTEENSMISDYQDDISVFSNSDNTSSSISYVVNKNGNYAPVITAFNIYDGEVYDTVSRAEIGDTIALTAKALDPDAEDEIVKIEFYCTGQDGKRQLIAVDSDGSDGWQYLWTLTSDYGTDYCAIAALAQDSYGNYSQFSEVDFQILEKNYHPEITSIALDADSYYMGQTINVSGIAKDVDNNGIDSVRLYLDTDKDGKASYPDEYLGLAGVNSDGSWSYTLMLDSDFEVGSYMIFAEAVDSLDMLTGEAAGVSFMVSSPTVSDLEITTDSIQWKKTSTDTCIIEYSQDKFQTTLAIKSNAAAVDMINLSDGEYQVRAKYDTVDMWNEAQTISIDETDKTSLEFVSNADGIGDIFFASGYEIWTARYVAQHVGSVNDWEGTQEQFSLTEKNKITDVFEGSADANILLLTDDANGDALFVDDVYSAFPANPQARIAQIDEIRAGAGDDIVDMTSQQFEYVGDGLTIRGGEGNDTIWANKGNNMLFGDAGNDRLVGASGNDVLSGGIGNDSMHGGGGNDTFCFCENWGADTVEQLSNGTVTLWFANGSQSNWDQDTMIYFDGTNSVKVKGIAADKVSLKFGDDSSSQFDTLTDLGAFNDFSSEKIFEEKDKGILVSL